MNGMADSLSCGYEVGCDIRIGGARMWVSVSPAPAALVGLYPCVTPVGNGATDPLAWCQGRVTESSGSGWGLFVKVCSLVRVNFLSIIVSHNVYKTSTLI